MIKLDSLSRWLRLPAGDVLTLKGDAQRRIRLQVNSPKRISLWIVNDHGEPTFLASPVGRDVVEFAAGGDVRLTTDDDDVYVYTAESEPTFTIFEDAEIFTKIAERRARNPDLEYLMQQQQINMDRRMSVLAGELNNRVNEAYEAGRMAHAVDTRAAAAQNDAGQAERNADTGASTSSAGQAASSETSSAGTNPPAGQPPVGEPAPQ